MAKIQASNIYRMWRGILEGYRNSWVRWDAAQYNFHTARVYFGIQNNPQDNRINIKSPKHLHGYCCNIHNPPSVTLDSKNSPSSKSKYMSRSIQIGVICLLNAVSSIKHKTKKVDTWLGNFPFVHNSICRSESCAAAAQPVKRRESRQNKPSDGRRVPSEVQVQVKRGGPDSKTKDTHAHH